MMEKRRTGWVAFGAWIGTEIPSSGVVGLMEEGRGCVLGGEELF
jgi:hypothetical protein